MLQAAMPNDFLGFPSFLKAGLGRLFPRQRLMDNVPVDADVPWEEEMALTAVGRLSFYHVSFFPRRMAQVFQEAVLFGNGNPDLVA